MKNTHLALTLFAALILTACVTSTPAPVETRVARPATPDAPATARPGYYIVKKGDTLYSIALENGHDYRDIAAWNNLDNPSLINVGQELRVVPPGLAIGQAASSAASGVSGGTTQAVIIPRIEARPADASGATATPQPRPAVQDNGIVTEPKGGRIAYSEKAWRDLTGQSEPRVAPAASAPLAASEPKPAPRPAPAPADTKAGDDKPDWIWPSNGKVIANFNDSTNKGVDIAGAVGDPVVAADAGKVIYVGLLRGYGNLVIIKHGSQFTTAYGHNKEVLVKEQQMVQKGQKIAVMGDSDADRPKLHFELRMPGGKPVDPLKYLPNR